MTTLISRPRLAVLIDAENASAAQASFVMDKAALLSLECAISAFAETGRSGESCR